jgi:hypothetical protein
MDRRSHENQIVGIELALEAFSLGGLIHFAFAKIDIYSFEYLKYGLSEALITSLDTHEFGARESKISAKSTAASIVVPDLNTAVTPRFYTGRFTAVGKNVILRVTNLH